MAASKGVTKGNATLILTLEEGAKLFKEGILVCPSTTPTWTALMAKASAVVTDTGGPLSHTSIIARELGIPCVVGTVQATTLIKNGDLITVDGGKGTILLAQEGEN